MEILEKRIHKILARISDVADFRRIAADALRGDTDVVVSGLSGSARALFIAGLAQALRRPLIVVTPQDRAVESLATDIQYFHAELPLRRQPRTIEIAPRNTQPRNIKLPNNPSRHSLKTGVQNINPIVRQRTTYGELRLQLIFVTQAMRCLASAL